MQHDDFGYKDVNSKHECGIKVSRSDRVFIKFDKEMNEKLTNFCLCLGLACSHTDVYDSRNCYKT